ncbi:DUF1127 domain-containing protein [Pseudomonas sp.]|uniref:DUF1127 domain-containing protein n=1 Tax=Pseudomonas sp. TaxID=306 RepID=UPI0027323237|nr:DUF1127 domain-containing protein [Pseudomonas sp.]MDP3814109.1 DUF1127 domain-containing protein [Pseudomonas sp.]
MNGLSDVRLTVKAEELQEDARAGHLYGRSSKGATLVERWQLFYRRLSTRRALLELSDEQLKDVGLTREQARSEALRPFWTL